MRDTGYRMPDKVKKQVVIKKLGKLDFYNSFLSRFATRCPGADRAKPSQFTIDSICDLRIPHSLFLIPH